LLLGDLQLRLRRLQIRFGLIVLVLDVARIDLHEEGARLHEVSRLDRHLRDEARCLGLHFDDIDRLDGAGGLGVDDDRAPRNDRGLHEWRFVPIAAARGGTENSGERQREDLLHERVSGVEKDIPDYTRDR